MELITPLDPRCAPGGRLDLVDAARTHAVDALVAIRADWTHKPIAGPHPRQDAIELAREAALHLRQVLDVEAPHDAIIDTQHALEELDAAAAEIRGFDPDAPLAAREPAVARFEKAIALLDNVHAILTDPDRIGIP